MKKIWCLFILLVFCSTSFAVVIRHDKSADDYVVKKPPQYLVNMPHEGQGVLIAPNWVLTVAHVIFYDYQGKTIDIAGKEYVIESVFIHKDYRKLESSTLDKGTKATMDFQFANRDIALVKLSTSVDSVSPLSIYTKSDELGKRVIGYGKGATGDGIGGAVFETKRDKVLRKLENKIEEVTPYWLAIAFDQPEKALPLEGIDGSGDSGGPVIIKKDGREWLVGMFSWDYVDGPLSDFQAGLYGHKSYQVRVSSYQPWISSIIAAN
ncbi:MULTISPECIES: trypsin-like serine protease [Thalassotalea]|uniref:trypsin-like serine protease n=1 Tax=Thalassotalea TaxID=1518149 RepID=UPI0009450B82|nr:MULTISPECIES: trypsin-like serine protease [Thalassotalea]OKY25642.1 hypothetical protein BI291_15535 [Thalassotalea sp. PP2-459]